MPAASEAKSGAIIKRAWWMVDHASQVFKVAFHWGFIPFIVYMGLTTKWEVPTSRGNVEVTPSLRELLLPVAADPQTGEPKFIVPI